MRLLWRQRLGALPTEKVEAALVKVFALKYSSETYLMVASCMRGLVPSDKGVGPWV